MSADRSSFANLFIVQKFKDALAIAAQCAVRTGKDSANARKIVCALRNASGQFGGVKKKVVCHGRKCEDGP